MNPRSCSLRLHTGTAQSKPIKTSISERHSFQFLIVDDHSLVRNGLKQILESAYPGAALFEAGDAREALDCVMKQKPDIVLLDISLPGKSGLDVRSEEHTSELQSLA